MGRVDADPATALREHLVDAAAELLETHQLSQITTRLLASSAGVSDGVLYNYFADKHEVLVAALLRRHEGLLAGYETGLPEPGSATVEVNLVAYVEAALELVRQTLPVAAGLVSEPTLLHRFMAAIHSHPFGPRRVNDPLTRYLTAEQQLGRVGPVPVDAVVSLLHGAAMTLAANALVAGTSQEERAAGVPEIVRVLLTGIDGAGGDGGTA